MSNMSIRGTTPNMANRRQKRMGPAPFASFEDLSDELESPEDQNAAGSVVRLPGIREDATPSITPSSTPATDRPEYVGISLVGAAVSPHPRTSLQAPTTPRIDISRASSSSHHDSRDSSPERELFVGPDPATAKLGLGFREEGALDLRSSTEELDFQEHQPERRRPSRPRAPSPHDDAAPPPCQRKDSQSSEMGMLSISGRTSRLSSIGSAGSGQSRLSNASHLSVISGQSGISRSPSPHKMLLETSFCGPKPPDAETAHQEGTKIEALEKALLSRKSDPTAAILAEGISVQPVDTTNQKTPPEKPARKSEQSKRVQSVKSDITIKVDEPPPICIKSNNNTPKLPKKIVADSGVEYIYIPLKGPLPVDSDAEQPLSVVSKPKLRQVKSATVHSKSNAKESSAAAAKPRAKSAAPSPIVQKKEDEPKYIRIKLKPDYMYSEDKNTSSSSSSLPEVVQKPESLDWTEKRIIIMPLVERKEEVQKVVEQGKISLSSTPNASPKPSRHGIVKDIGSKTPSPSLSRKSSFASLFRSKETIISPESPTVPGSKQRKNTITGILREATDVIKDKSRSRSRSKSRDRDRSATSSAAPSSSESIDSKSKQKSVFSIFKPKKEQKSDFDSSQEVLPSIEGIAKVEFKFNDNVNAKPDYEKPLEGDSIRIPLHSPTHYDNHHNILQELKTSSQDSQETVIEATCRNVEAVVEAIPHNFESNTNKVQSSKPELTHRQSSTSSENVIFSTKLGSDNEIFTTKLPKDKQKTTTTTTTSNNDQRATETNGPNEHLDLEEKLPVQEQHCVKIEKSTEKNEPEVVNRNSTISSAADEERESSESERDTEIDFVRNRKDLDLKLDFDLEPERKGLVLQQDSYEDELPYVPTTLPLERSAAVPIVPIKQRSTYEMKTCPIERPRSTTPINPSCLEEYCEEVMGTFNYESVTKTIEKLKISLPRHDYSVDKPMKSPRKTGNWFEFAEKGISTGRRPSLQADADTPPPLPPKGVQREWINFEEIPERRRPPKRIQTLPSRGHIDVPECVLQDNVVYNYVNPEECKCECHEITARERIKREQESGGVQEDELPLLDDEPAEEEKTVHDASEKIKLDVVASDRRSVISDSSVDLSVSIEPPETNGIDLTLRTPFTSDLGLSSNRSSIMSQDEPHSPDSESPNAFPKTS